MWSVRPRTLAGPAQIAISRSVQQALAGQANMRIDGHARISLAGKAEQEDASEMVWAEPPVYTGVALRENRFQLARYTKPLRQSRTSEKM